MDRVNRVRGRDIEDSLKRKLNHLGTDPDPDANTLMLSEVSALGKVASLEAAVARASQRRRRGKIDVLLTPI